MKDNESIAVNLIYANIDLFQQQEYNHFCDFSVSGIYEFHKYERQFFQQFSTSAKKLSFEQCQNCLFSHFIFDPAFINGCKCKEFSIIEQKYGLISNVFGFISSSFLNNQDYFSLIISSLISFLNLKFDKHAYNCIFILIFGFKSNPNNIIDSETIKNLLNYLTSNAGNNDNLMEIITILLEQAKTNNDESVMIEIVQAINELILLDTSSFNETNYSTIFDYISILLDKMEFNALGLLGTISDVNSSSYILDLYSKLANTVVNQIQKYYKENNLKFPESVDEGLIPKEIINFSFNSIFCKNLNQKLNPPKSDSYYSQINISDILNEEQLAIFDFFRYFLHRKSDNIPITFLLEYSNLLRSNYSRPYFVELYIFLIHILETFQELSFPTGIMKIIIQSPVFSSKYLLFFNEENFQLLNYLRNITFKIIMKNWPYDIPYFLSDSESSPFLFAEHIGRINSVISYSNISSFLTKSLATDISSILKYFACLMEKNKNPIIFSAYSAIFIFLINAVEDQEGAKILFSSYSFLDIFLAHIYHDSLRSIVLNLLRNFLSQSFSREAFDNIISYINGLFQKSIPVDIARDFLECIGDSITHNQEISSYFLKSITYIFHYFFNNPTKELVKSIISILFILICNVDDFKLPKNELIEFGHVIKGIEKNEYSNLSYSMLFSLMSGNKFANVNTMAFLVKNPFTILLILSIVSDNYRMILEKFSELCDFSIYNRIQFQKGGLDLFLIELLHSYPNDFEFESIHFKQIFTETDLDELVYPLLMKIFEYKSSYVSIERFISIAIPNEKGEFTASSNKVIDCLLSLLTSKNKIKPEIKYTYYPNAKSISEKINLDPTGYTFSCYLLKDQATNSTLKPLLFQISDQMSTFKLYISGNSVFCEQKTPNTFSSAPILNSLPLEKWILLTVISRLNQTTNITTISISFDKRQPHNFTLPNPNFDFHNLYLTYGGFYEQSQNSQSINCFLGDIFIFNVPFNYSELSSFYTNNTYPSENLITKPLVNKTGFIQTFSDVLAKYNFEPTISYFFKFIQQALPQFMEKLIDICQLLKDSSIFTYMPYYMVQFENSFLVYSLYLRFYTLFTLTNHESILKNLLFNFRLWTSAESIHLKRIVKHWADVLFPTYSTVFLKYFSFSSILSQIRLYFYFSMDDSEFVEIHGEIKEIKACRSNLNKLLYQYASISLKNEDIESIISHIYTCNDIEQKCSFLSLLENISKFINDKEAVANQLHPLLLNSNPSILISVICTLITLTGSSQLSNISFLLPMIKISKELYDCILTLLNSYPELLPIASQISIHLHCENDLALILSNQSFDFCNYASRLSSCRTWYIYPIILVLFITNDLQKEILNIILTIMLTNYNVTNICEMFCLIDLLQEKYDLNFYKIKLLLFQIMLEHKLIQTHEKDILSVCLHYLFSTFDSEIHSDALQNLFLKSPFYEQKFTFHPPKENISLNIYGEIGFHNFSNLNLVTRLNVGNDKDIIFNILKLIRDLIYKSESKGSDLLCFLSYIDSILDEKKQSILSEILEISNYTATFYHHNFTIICNLQNYFKMVCKRSQELLLFTPNIQLSLNSLHYQQISIEIESVQASNKDSKNQCQEITPYSVWKLFALKSIKEHVTFKMDDDFQKTLMKPIIPKVQIPSYENSLKINPLLSYEPIYIQPQKQIKCKLIITQSCMYIITEIVIQINNKDIRYILQREGEIIEVITTNGRSYCFQFQSNDFSNIISSLKPQHFNKKTVIQKVPFSQFITQMNLTNDWVEGKISNLKYLLQINILGGRSYAIEDKYPILPFIRDFDFDIGYDYQPSTWLEFFKNNNKGGLKQKFYELYDQQKLELTPEFYSLPECFESLVDEPVRFVYENRYQLESDAISHNINLWIDNVFGINHRIDTPQLFYYPHPMKKIKEEMKSKKNRISSKKRRTSFDVLSSNEQKSIQIGNRRSSIDYDLKSDINSCLKDFQLQIQDVQISNMFFVKDGLIVRCMSSTGVFIEIIIYLSYSTIIPIYEKQVSIKNSIVASTSNGFGIINNLNSEITFISKDSIKTIQIESYYPYYAIYNGVNILCYSREGTGFLINENDGSISSICHVSPELPSCISSSQKFKIIIVGVESKKLIYFNEHGKYIRTVEIDVIPQKIIITNEWGFVIVQSGKTLLSLTINGTKISQENIQFEIECWTCWSSVKGFDYIICSDVYNRLSIFEPMRMESFAIISLFNNKINSISVNQSFNGIFVIMQNGKIIYIPYILP